jgi:outer membrane usher protein
MLLLAWSVNINAQTLAQSDDMPEDQATPMEVIINGNNVGTWLIVEHEGVLYAARGAFDIWRVLINTDAPYIVFRGHEYWSLAAGEGYASTFNATNQSLDLHFSPEAFTKTQIGKRFSNPSNLDTAVPSLFVNYDLNYLTTQSQNASSMQNVGMLGEIGFSTSRGLFTSSAIGRNLTGNKVQGNVERSLVRLESGFTIDDPDRKASLVLGDTNTRTSAMGSSIYFGGLRMGSNFELAPGFIRQAVPVLSGVSVVPSTVSLYVDGILRQTTNVAPGPFSIVNSPYLTGAGEARLVVRDLLGRETVITRSFLSSSQLLAVGLDDWSFEAGRMRQDLGIASANYGSAFMRGFWRRGLNESLTLEGVAQGAKTQNTLGLGLTTVVTGKWLGSAALKKSHDDTIGDGAQWLLGLQRQGLRTSAFVQVQGATQKFRDLGQGESAAPIQMQWVANATYVDDHLGAFGAGLTSTRTFIGQAMNTLALNYSIPVGARGTLSMTAGRTLGEFKGTSIGLSLVLPLDHDRMLSTSANRSHQQNDSYVAAMKNPTQHDSLGWRLLAGQQQAGAHQEGGLNYLGSYGQLNADLSASTYQRSFRLSGNGGLVLTEGHLFATHYQNTSFALVEVAGYDNVAMGLGNHMMTRTNSKGIALIPHLASYQKNSVNIDPQDLPVSAELDSIAQIAVPARRSVVKVVFPVRNGRAALLKIKLDDGGVVPAGAVVQIEDEDRDFYVAHRGEAFVTGLQDSNQLKLLWKNQDCLLTVNLPHKNLTEIARVGPLICHGVRR